MRLQGRRAPLLAASLTLLTAAGCDEESGDNAMMDAGRDAGMDASTDTGTVDARIQLSHAQVLGVLAALNQGEITLSQLATSTTPARTNRAEVRAFALEMIDEHTDAQVRQTQLAQTLSLTPAPSTQTAVINNMVPNFEQRLSSMSGPAFDTEFLMTQQLLHSLAVSYIDDILLHSVQDSLPLREEVTLTRAEMLTHGNRAGEVRTRIASDAGANDAGANDAGTDAGATDAGT